MEQELRLACEGAAMEIARAMESGHAMERRGDVPSTAAFKALIGACERDNVGAAVAAFRDEAAAFGEALVAAEDADEASAKKLVAAVYRELLPAYVPLATARAPAAPPADRPSRLLASRNSWDHPVAANACVASGVPGLLANCNVR